MIYNILCLIAFVRLLCFLIIYSKAKHELIKNKRLVISNHHEDSLNNVHISCTQDSAFGVYCKSKMNIINEDYVLDDHMDIAHMERSYYGIYKDHILFA